MTHAVTLERGYRGWLRLYPKRFRHEHEAEILEVLMATASEDQSRPEALECLDLMLSALLMRFRPRVPRSDRSTLTAVKVMYLGALVEVATAITILATIGEVKSRVVNTYPGLTKCNGRQS